MKLLNLMSKAARAAATAARHLATVLAGVARAQVPGATGRNSSIAEFWLDQPLCIISYSYCVTNFDTCS
jgi:hypothetical protein